VRGENSKCSHARTGDATAEKVAEKNREKFNELNFFATKSRTLSPSVATTVRRRRDNLKKGSHHHHQQGIAGVAAALIHFE